MKFYAYVHDKDGLTRPVFVKVIECGNEGEALSMAMKDPGVRAIVGKQQTGTHRIRELFYKRKPLICKRGI